MGYNDWTRLAPVFKLERCVWQPPSPQAELTTQPLLKSYEVRYGVISLPRVVEGGAKLMKLVREGWGIENGLHHRRDVQFREDYSQLRQGIAAQVNAVLNNTALVLLLRSGVSNIAETGLELA